MLRLPSISKASEVTLMHAMDSSSRYEIRRESLVEEQRPMQTSLPSLDIDASRTTSTTAPMLSNADASMGHPATMQGWQLFQQHHAAGHESRSLPTSPVMFGHSASQPSRDIIPSAREVNVHPVAIQLPSQLSNPYPGHGIGGHYDLYSQSYFGTTGQGAIAQSRGTTGMIKTARDLFDITHGRPSPQHHIARPRTIHAQHPDDYSEAPRASLGIDVGATTMALSTMINDATLTHATEEYALVERSTFPEPGTIYAEIRKQHPKVRFRNMTTRNELYCDWRGEIRTREQAFAYLARKRWKPEGSEHDASIPLNDDQKAQYARELYGAMIDFKTGFVDKVQTHNKVNRLVQRVYTQEEIEARCVQAVHLATRLHTEGSWILASTDAAYEARHRPKELAAKGQGVDNYKLSHRSEADRNMSFRQRWDALCAACQACKAVATDILDGDKMEAAIYCPRLHMSVKISNMTNNDNKQLSSTATKRKRERANSETADGGEPKEEDDEAMRSQSFKRPREA